MKDKDTVILNKILSYCNQCEEACEMFENDFEKFKSVSVFHNSCCMCILQIGELCKLLSVQLKESQSSVKWKEWCGIRDVFAHQYSNLDYDSAWDTIQNDLKDLKKSVNAILEKRLI